MLWPFARAPMQVQTRALELGAGQKKYGYFLDPGLGKTALALADFWYNQVKGNVDALAVVCPNYLKPNWAMEAREFGFPFPLIIWPEEAVNVDGPFAFVINYEALLTSGGKYLDQLLRRRRFMLTLDESTRIKNFNSKVTKVLMVLAKHCEYRRELTGTPMTQNVMELWSQLRFLGQLNGVNPYAFRNRYAVMGGWMGKQVTGIREEHKQELTDVMKLCSFRACKDDWEDLPEKRYLSRYFKMGKDQAAAYESMRTEFLVKIENDQVLANQVIHMMMKLQQISRGFIIDESGAVRWFVPRNANPAIRLVEDILEDTPGKALTFSFHTASVNALHDVIGGLALRGGMTPDEITEVKAAFNGDPKVRYLHLQTSVGAMGHTLLGGSAGDRCSTSIFYENTYSREKRTQAEDRIHRKGQDRSTTYYDVIGSKQDERVIGALIRRQDMINAVVEALRAAP